MYVRKKIWLIYKKLFKVINDNETYIYPEYESIKEIALNNKIPLKELYKINEFILKDEEGAVKKAPSFILFIMHIKMDFQYQQ